MSILERLRNDEHDGFMFLPTDDENTVHVESFKYQENTKKIRGSDLGYYHHILIWKEKEDGDMDHFDLFEAILVDPLIYASDLINMKWYGIIGIKTEKSEEFFNDIMERIKNEVEDIV